MDNKSQEKVRRFAMIGALIGLVIGIGVGVFGFWMSYSETAPVVGMMLVSMGFPACILIGAVIGVFFGQRK